MNYNINQITKFLYENIKDGVNLLLNFLIPPNKKYQKIKSLSHEEFLTKTEKSSKTKDFLSFFAYKDPLVRDALHLIKYQNKIDIGELLGQSSADMFMEQLENWFTFENFEKPLLIPIPLSKEKMKQRGFNQCEIIAKEIIKNLPSNILEIDTSSLRKIKNTKNQVETINRQERLENLKNCFWADNKKISGRNIIIFDDIITTGATTKEAKDTVLKAGAKKVKIISIAH